MSMTEHTPQLPVQTSLKAIRRRELLASIGGLALAGIAGCGYSVRPPYNNEIRTVYVPIFRSLTFRRDLNLMLTEAVAKEIEKRTPYKVVGTPDGADSSLTGEVTYADKNLVVENPQNLPRPATAPSNSAAQPHRPAAPRSAQHQPRPAASPPSSGAQQQRRAASAPSSAQKQPLQAAAPSSVRPATVRSSSAQQPRPAAAPTGSAQQPRRPAAPSSGRAQQQSRPAAAPSSRAQPRRPAAPRSSTQQQCPAAAPGSSACPQL